MGPLSGSVEQTWSRNTVHISKLALPLRILNLRKLGHVHLDARCPAGFLQTEKMRNICLFFFPTNHHTQYLTLASINGEPTMEQIKICRFRFH